MDFAGYQGLIAPCEIRLSTGDVVNGNFTGAFFAFDFLGMISTLGVPHADLYIGPTPGANPTAQPLLLDNLAFSSACRNQAPSESRARDSCCLRWYGASFAGIPRKVAKKLVY